MAGGRDLARLAGAAVGRVASTVEDVHMAVLDRSMAVLAGAADTEPVGAVAGWHRSAARLVYASVRATSSVAGAAAGEAAARAGGAALPPRLAGVLNAALGDHLATTFPELVVPTTLRAWPAEPGPAGVADATGQLVVFVHGLAETDRSWAYRSEARWDRPASTYGARLAGLGWSARYAQYNTGLHISDSAAALDVACEALVEQWPMGVRRIALVGHSMGGLVARAALHQARERRASWSDSIDTVVALGSPLLGADLEKGANVAAWALAGLPELRPFARLVNGRSAGVKDLRFGYLQAGDWADWPPDELLQDRRRHLPGLPGVAYHSVSATIRGLAGALLGDGVVRIPSASGRTRSGSAVEVHDHVTVTGINHMDLLNHPAVDPLLARWLA